jgi:glycosidase
MLSNPPVAGLAETIARLVRLRSASPALQSGTYRQLHISSQQLVFLREFQGEKAVVALNASDQAQQVRIDLMGSGQLVEFGDSASTIPIQQNAAVIALEPFQARWFYWQ